MLARCVLTVWGAWIGGLSLAVVLTASAIWSTSPIIPLGLAALMIAGGLGLIVGAAVRVIRGPRRVRAVAALLVGTAPFWFLAGHILMAARSAIDRRVPPGWPTKLFLPLGRPFVDLEARWFYPQRTRGQWVTMAGPPTADARAQVVAMDRHVEAVLARLGQSGTWPILWYRGPVLGIGRCAIYDMAFGSPLGREPQGADGLSETDRHEVAHCVITRNYTAWSDPPRLLMEGWAQANQGTSAEELACTAWEDRQKGESLSLRKLVAPDWYWYSGLSTYNQGAPLVNYVLRVYGPERFLKLYINCQQATFESDLRECLGIGFDELDAAYWADVERIVQSGPPARHWLKGLPLAPGIDPAAWQTFLADYFAAAAQLVARYDHVRMTSVYRNIKNGDDREKMLEKRTMLRSGRFARVRTWFETPFVTSETAILAHPDHSLRVFRELTPEVVPWTIRTDARATPLAAYQQAMDRVESSSNYKHFAATHGGAILLEYPGILRNARQSTEYEVAGLDTTIKAVEGHRLVTLRLRTVPGIKGRDREESTFVFDADDLFVVRSEHYENPHSGFISDCRFEYDHPDGRPVLRSSVIPVSSQHRTIRLDVEECRFGPIPESEFALEPFLASLGPGRPVRPPAFDPPASTGLDWYWLVFVGGGISLAAGSGLALVGRDRRTVLAN